MSIRPLNSYFSLFAVVNSHLLMYYVFPKVLRSIGGRLLKTKDLSEGMVVCDRHTHAPPLHALKVGYPSEIPEL